MVHTGLTGKNNLSPNVSNCL